MDGLKKLAIRLDGKLKREEPIIFIKRCIKLSEIRVYDIVKQDVS